MVMLYGITHDVCKFLYKIRLKRGYNTLIINGHGKGITVG